MENYIPSKIRARLKIHDLDIIMGLAEGDTSGEIGLILDMTDAQVNARVYQLRLIFEVKTTPQLIAHCYHHGILKPRVIE